MKLNKILNEIKLTQGKKISFDLLKVLVSKELKDFVTEMADEKDIERNIKLIDSSISEAKDLDDLANCVGYFGYNHQESLEFIIGVLVE